MKFPFSGVFDVTSTFNGLSIIGWKKNRRHPSCLRWGWGHAMKQKERKFYRILSCYLCQKITRSRRRTFLSFLLTNCLCMNQRVELTEWLILLIKVADDNAIENLIFPAFRWAIIDSLWLFAVCISFNSYDPFDVALFQQHFAFFSSHFSLLASVRCPHRSQQSWLYLDFHLRTETSAFFSLFHRLISPRTRYTSIV